MFSDDNYNHNYIVCTKKNVFMSLNFIDKCTGQELRLVPANESVPYKGRLEACQDGRFLPVCGYYYWDCNDAIVACKHLGFENSCEMFLM